MSEGSEEEEYQFTYTPFITVEAATEGEAREKIADQHNLPERGFRFEGAQES